MCKLKHLQRIMSTFVKGLLSGDESKGSSTSRHVIGALAYALPSLSIMFLNKLLFAPPFNFVYPRLLALLQFTFRLLFKRKLLLRCYFCVNNAYFALLIYFCCGFISTVVCLRKCAFGRSLLEIKNIM